MKNVMDFPLIFSTLSFLALWMSALIGTLFREKLRPLQEGQRGDFDVVQAATLTLLGLLIGFTFSMAIERYEQRKNYEAAEANAIGTEYVRADLLPAEESATVRNLLGNYLDQRVLFYTNRDEQRLQQGVTATAQLQKKMWAAVQARAAVQPTPTIALTVSGMNDVLNSQGYAQAAWWNRIPMEAWVLLTGIAIGCNLLIGYGARRKSTFLFMVLPLAVSISFFLIADIDSPRGGVIRVQPQNLMDLSLTLRSH
jgi:hypothetical protein